MAREIFINLPVKDLQKTMEFFGALGFTFNKQFTDEKAACMVVSEKGYVMLLKEDFFKSFCSKEICDTATHIEVMTAIALENREAVDEMMQKVLQAGGTEPRPSQDYGWMYQRTFQDLDGHFWEPFWMDPTHIQ